MSVHFSHCETRFHSVAVATSVLCLAGFEYWPDEALSWILSSIILQHPFYTIGDYCVLVMVLGSGGLIVFKGCFQNIGGKAGWSTEGSTPVKYNKSASSLFYIHPLLQIIYFLEVNIDTHVTLCRVSSYVFLYFTRYLLH
jgi:hypothetical protein